MRIVEEQQLNKFAEEFKSFKIKHETPLKFYSYIFDLPEVSLQEFSQEKDLKFFDEVSFIISVIASIISHPHIANKREDVILRVEQAQSVQADEFKRVVQDSKLWKQHGNKMLPEEIHHYQYVDELCIYENRFIVLLINLLYTELQKYAQFYVSVLPSVENNQSGIELYAKSAGEIIDKIDGLRKKLDFLKGTYFYREISKTPPISKNVKPTNILLKDKLYKHCYKFYRKVIRYGDENVLKRDLRDYYLVLLLKQLKNLNFYLISRPNTSLNDCTKLTFINEVFELLVEYDNKNNGLIINVHLYSKPYLNAKHLLLFDVGDEEINTSFYENKYHSISAMSVWNLKNADNDISFKNTKTETELIEFWLLSTIQTVYGEKEIYSRFCPVCKAKHVLMENDKCLCGTCYSEFAFYRNSNSTKDLIWFIKQRRQNV